MSRKFTGNVTSEQGSEDSPRPQDFRSGDVAASEIAGDLSRRFAPVPCITLGSNTEHVAIAPARPNPRIGLWGSTMMLRRRDPRPSGRGAGTVGTATREGK